MIEAENTDAVGVLGDLDAAGVLASIKEVRDVEQAAAARQLDLAAKWADLHPTDSLANAAAFDAPGWRRTNPSPARGSAGTRGRSLAGPEHVGPAHVER